MREHITSRRAVIKAAGALGTITALAVPVAVLPKAEAAEHPDTELLAMARELEQAQAYERAASAEESRLAAVAKRIRPAPSPALRAYHHEEKPLMRKLDDGGWVTDHAVLAYVMDCARTWRITGFCEGEGHEDELLKHLERWRETGHWARQISGAHAAAEEWEQASNACNEICRRIVNTPAATAEGIRVKLMALHHCCGDDVAEEWIADVIAGQNSTTDERLVFSVCRDALRILGVGGAHV